MSSSLYERHARHGSATENVERRYSLHDRYLAVRTFVHAIDHLSKQQFPFDVHANAQSILRDGIYNALDHRSTGREWRNVRHTYNNERDGRQPPEVADGDRRCEQCGAPNYVSFTRCGTTTHVEVGADVATPSLDSIYSAIEDALNSYRMQHTRELPDLNNGLSLLDRLTPDDDRDVTRGRAELDLLIDYVCGAVGDVFWSTAGADVATGEDVCWHCGDVLAWTSKPRCETCPDECDIEGCEAFGCDTAAPAVAGPTEDADFDSWWDKYQEPHLPNGLSGYGAAKDAWLAARIAAPTPSTCLMADCNEPHAHFCVSHVLEVYAPSTPDGVREAAQEIWQSQCCKHTADESLGLKRLVAIISKHVVGPREDPESRYCGFCRKTEYEVPTLISAAVGYICNECVKICAEIIERNQPANQQGIEESSDQSAGERIAAGNRNAEALAVTINAALSKAKADTWAKAIKVAQESTKKSISAKLDVAAAEILIRRLEAAAQSEKGK